MFQENLLNDGFDLIAAEIFSDDPKSSIESLKVSLRSKFYSNLGNFYLWNPKSRKVLLEESGILR